MPELMERDDIIWMAGLFEGEGCIYFDKQRQSGVTLILTMTDEDVVQRFYEATGRLGKVRMAPGKRLTKVDGLPMKQAWRWEAHHKLDVARLLCAMAPLFGERRCVKAMEAAERLACIKTQHRGVHGTNAGWQTHNRKKEVPCRECVEARSAYQRAAYLRRKSA